MSTFLARRVAAQQTPKFFQSNIGKNVVRTGGVLVVVGGFMGCVGLNTWFIKTYRDNCQHHENGFPVPMSDKLESLKVKVVEEMNIYEKFRKFVRLYHNVGFEPFSVGSLKMTHGVYIGLPKHFVYEDIKDVETGRMEIEGKSVRWQLEEGQELKESLVLSDNAKMFTIAQQIALTNNYYPYMQGGFFSGSMMLYVAITMKANEKLFGFQRPPIFRYLMYTIVGTFCYGLWTMCKDMYSKHWEKLSDEKALSLGLDYAKGGVEYYAKVIQRNIALRGLMGPKGEETYTQFGNLREFIKIKHVRLTDRKKGAEKFIETHYVQNNEEIVDKRSDEKKS